MSTKSLTIGVADNGFILHTTIENPDDGVFDSSTQVFVSPSKLLKVVRTFIEDHGTVQAPKVDTAD